MLRSRRTQRLSPLAPIAAAALAVLAVASCGSSGDAAPPPPPAHLADTAAASLNAVTVTPFPGTPDASPTTQVTFLGPAGTTVSDVTVSGSSSGRHDGRLERYSTGTGESFLPAHPFTPGEQVTVTARVRAAGHGAIVRTSFAIGFEAPANPLPFPNSPGKAADVQHFRSAPGLTPSRVRITTPAQPGATPGDLFLAPYQGLGTPGNMIADQAGNLIWFHRLPAGEDSSNFRVQRYEGRPVLTWWQGRILELGFGQGVDEIYDSSYRPLAAVRAGNGYHADLHEFLLTPQGTAWIDIFDPVVLNLSSLGASSREIVNDSIVQEIDVRTGLVMWEWHALGHVALRDSHNRIPHTTNWDYVHVNSVDPGAAGGVLLSARNTWALYDVDLHSGGFIWRLGGKHGSSFRAGTGTRFYWQHDAEWQPGGLVSVFDNGSSPPYERQSRGLLLDPGVATHVVTLVHAFTNPHARLLASSQGNLLSLPGGNWLMGYGGLPNFTEYDGSGRVLLDGTLGAGVQDFRTYLSPWSATPATAPSVAAQAAGGGAVTVEASWNGATAVSSWRVLAGSTRGSLAPVMTVPRHGFETAVSVRTAAPLVAVAALDAGGATLATSAPVSTRG